MSPCGRNYHNISFVQRKNIYIFKSNSHSPLLLIFTKFSLSQLSKQENMPKIYCLADLCMVPIGTNSASVSDFVAIIERKIRESHLKSTLHSAGTTIEGPWDEVFTLIGELHELAHKNDYVRIQSSLRVGTRTDKHQTAQDKVDTLLQKLEKPH